MANVPVWEFPEAAPPQILGDIVAAVRFELNQWIPALLAPLVEELKAFNRRSLQEKQQGQVKICTLPTVATCESASASDHVIRSRSHSVPAHQYSSGITAGMDERMVPFPALRTRSRSLPHAFLGAQATAAAALGPAAVTLDSSSTACSSTGNLALKPHAFLRARATTVAAAGAAAVTLEETSTACSSTEHPALKGLHEVGEQQVADLAFRLRSRALPPLACLGAATSAALGAAAAADGSSTASSSEVREWYKDGSARTIDDQLVNHGPFSPTTAGSLISHSPMQMSSEMEMTMPLVAAAGQPEDGTMPREALLRWSWRNLLGGQQNHDQNGAYSLLPSRCDTMSRADTIQGSDFPVMGAENDEDEGTELTDPEAARRLPEEIASLEEKAAVACQNLEDLNALWKNRRAPYEEDIDCIRKEIDSLQEQLELASMPRIKEAPPPGPAALKFVDSETFSVVCNLVVLLNLAAMIMGPKFKSFAAEFKALDQVFLSWYVIELSLKAVYFQSSLIFGPISVVWWNWLDLGIVVSGVIDQWLIPLIKEEEGGHLHIPALRMLRTLRLFRLMRFLKIIKAFMKSDLAWTEGAAFEVGMAGVIAFNSIVMSLELDIPWAGWVYVENVLQVVYTFELALRIKRQCCQFFKDIDNLVWNYLDFIMVGGGAMDLWLVPLILALKGFVNAAEGVSPRRGSSSFSGILKILRILRILRVLRLVRLLKMVKPLYRLLIGVMESVKAMQWVLILTFLTLYACSIVFTNLVGKGLMSDGEVDDLAFEYFGSVPKSLFSLFKCMNGDTSVVEPITGSITGQLLFAGFMVVSNWAILAILTAVVSDNMITTSASANAEDDVKKSAEEHANRIRRLSALFKEIDSDGEGTISTMEWQGMMDDPSLHRELCDATGLHEDDLNDYFECLAKDPSQDRKDHARASRHHKDLRLDYQTFIDALKDEGALADKRSILHVLKQLRNLESHIKREFEELGVHESG